MRCFLLLLIFTYLWYWFIITYLCYCFSFFFFWKTIHLVSKSWGIQACISRKRQTKQSMFCDYDDYAIILVGQWSNQQNISHTFKSNYTVMTAMPGVAVAWFKRLLNLPYLFRQHVNTCNLRWKIILQTRCTKQYFTLLNVNHYTVWLHGIYLFRPMLYNCNPLAVFNGMYQIKWLCIQVNIFHPVNRSYWILILDLRLSKEREGERDGGASKEGEVGRNERDVKTC